MGAKQTKLSVNTLRDTSNLQHISSSSQSQEPTTKGSELSMEQLKSLEIPDCDEIKDPRSPSGCRTPLNLYVAQPQIQTPCQNGNINNGNEGAFDLLRKRFFKNFALDDPRSPQFNRTPLKFDDSTDKTLNLDDTFSNLFVETRAPTLVLSEQPNFINENKSPLEVDSDANRDSSVEFSSITFDEEATMPCNSPLVHTSPELYNEQTYYDPRSPTVGVDRTPIIFSDDDTFNEDQMLENVLETLTLNLSNDNSMDSFISKASNSPISEIQVQKNEKPVNKHLERIRLSKKHRIAPRKPARLMKQRQHIYVDDSDEEIQLSKTTPKLLCKSKNDENTERTPLSCVKNRTHLRSRSVETKQNKLCTNLPLQSFNDQFNPMANKNKSREWENMEDNVDMSIH